MDRKKIVLLTSFAQNWEVALLPSSLVNVCLGWHFEVCNWYVTLSTSAEGRNAVVACDTLVLQCHTESRSHDIVFSSLIRTVASRQ